jgi:hypothetical protein
MIFVKVFVWPLSVTGACQGKRAMGRQTEGGNGRGATELQVVIAAGADHHTQAVGRLVAACDVAGGEHQGESVAVQLGATVSASKTAKTAPLSAVIFGLQVASKVAVMQKAEAVPSRLGVASTRTGCWPLEQATAPCPAS